MPARRNWIRQALTLIAVAVVLKALAERRPEKLQIIVMVGGIGLAVFVAGWLFAVKRAR
jgi:hypothetical protein